MESKRGFQDCCSDLWSHQLQQDIVDLILERLGALDRIRFGAVCTRWREAVARSTATSALAFPFVLHAALHFPDTTHSLTSLDDNRVYYLNLNPCNTVYGTFLDVIEGRWLIMVQLYVFRPGNCRCERQRQVEVVTGYSILNPVTRKEFLLPTRRHPPLSDTCNFSDITPCFFSSMRASNSEPTTSSNCLVAGLSISGFLVGFCRLTDSEWTIINLEEEFKDFKCQEIMFFRGKLYALTTKVEDFIIAFDFDDNENGAYKAHKIVMTVPWQISLRSREVRHLQEGLVSSYSFYDSDVSLATDSVSGELLLIVRDAKFSSKKCPPGRENSEKVEVISLSVYRLYMNNDEGQWIKVTDLGDRILFNGNFSNFFIPTKAFEESTHQGNCIYYAFSPNEDCWDIGKFDLNNQTIIPCPIKRRKLAPAVGWLAPQFRKCEF